MNIYKIKLNKLLLATTLLSSSLLINTGFARVIHYDDKASYTKATGQHLGKLHESPYVKKYMPKLAPINVRLKDLDPLIEKPKQIGIYGGQANVFTMAPYAGQDIVGFMPFDMLLGLKSDDNTIMGSMAQAYKLSKDMKTMTFTLRKGIKWSDGVPLTSQELYNWHKYIIDGLKMSTDLNHFTMKVIDKRTFSITLDKPNALMPNLFADFAGSQVVKPFHYIKRFLPQFNKHITAEAKKAGFKSAEMYAKAEVNSFNVATGSLKQRINIPTLSAYLLTSKATDHWVYTRNPYYWKVDTAGNQLPYIDRIQIGLMNSPEVAVAKVLSGDADFSTYNTTTSKITIFKQHEKQGNYKTYIWNISYSAQPILGFNLAYNGPDKIGAKIVKDIRFRQAFSVMIDRQKMNDTLYFGKGLPSQMTIHPTSKYYKKEYAQAYAQYDPKLANKLLDQMGLKWDHSHKYRLRSDGKVLSFLIPITTNGASTSINFEMIQTFASQVGIKLILKDTEWVTLVHNRKDGNKYLIGAADGSGTTDLVAWVHPRFFVPYSSGNPGELWGMNYAKWFDAKRNHTKIVGVEPPQYVKDLYNTHLQMLATGDPAKRAILADKILQAQVKYLFTVGTIANPPKPVTARDNIMNMTEHGYTGISNKWGANYGPETKFFKRPLYKNQIIK